MSGHPRYRGPVVDAHVHVDGAHLTPFESAMTANEVASAVNLWNTVLPPPPFTAWRDELRRAARFPEEQVPYHVPDLEGIGQEGYEERLVGDLVAAVRQGAGGVKIWKNLGLRLRDTSDRVVPVDDSRLDPLWQTAGRQGLPVSIHIGDPVAFFEPLEPSNERIEELQHHPDWWFGGPEFPWHVTELVGQLERVVGRHPETCFVGVHMGCLAEDLGTVGQMLDRNANYFIDTAARIAEIGRQPSADVRAFFCRYADRILFGSDLVRTTSMWLPEPGVFGEDLTDFYATYWRYFETAERDLPHPYADQGAWTITGIDLPDTVLRSLYWENAQRLIIRPWRNRRSAFASP